MILQSNKITGTAYEGRNQAVLLSQKSSKNYSSDQWITFLQTKKSGLRIKRGSHGSTIVKFVEEEKVIDGKTVTVGGPRFYTVFNLDQTETI